MAPNRAPALFLARLLVFGGGVAGTGRQLTTTETSSSTAIATRTTTAQVYLPGYESGDWAALRGSIIGIAESITTYTIFCAMERPDCQIEGVQPFTFAENNKTLEYDATDAGKITATLQCQLEPTTAATCTGSTSFGPDYRDGSIMGPTQTAWTSAYTGSQVTWAILTLSTPGATAAATSGSSSAAAAAGAPALGGTGLDPGGARVRVARRRRDWQWAMVLSGVAGGAAALAYLAF